MKPILLGSRLVGDGQPCFVIAEAGSNHNGSFEQAVRLIDAAADAGADAVKFQVFRAERLYPKSAGSSNYLKLEKSIYDIISELEMPLDWIPRLASHCVERRLRFLASAFDEASVDALDPFVCGFKVASYEMTHYPLLRYVAGKNKPLIVSTGTASLAEVAETVRELELIGHKGLALLQCTAAYPTPLDALNLRAISTMKAEFNLPVGLSDHSRDPLVAPMAGVAIGANILEKHFTLSNRLPGPDHRFAVEPAELLELVRGVRSVEQALGNGDKVTQPIEEELRKFARRSIFTVKAIRAGQLLTAENVAVLRCGELPAGLPPRDYPAILGRQAVRDLPAEAPLNKQDYA